MIGFVNSTVCMAIFGDSVRISTELFREATKYGGSWVTETGLSDQVIESKASEPLK